MKDVSTNEVLGVRPLEALSLLMVLFVSTCCERDFLPLSCGNLCLVGVVGIEDDVCGLLSSTVSVVGMGGAVDRRRGLERTGVSVRPRSLFIRGIC